MSLKRESRGDRPWGSGVFIFLRCGGLSFPLSSFFLKVAPASANFPTHSNTQVSGRVRSFCLQMQRPRSATRPVRRALLVYGDLARVNGVSGVGPYAHRSTQHAGTCHAAAQRGFASVCTMHHAVTEASLQSAASYRDRSSPSMPPRGGSTNPPAPIIPRNRRRGRSQQEQR